jgi:hypothetical protein
MIARLNEEGQPALVYVHPWEIDPDPPRVEGLSFLQRLRNYGSTSILHHKLDRLLSDFDFVSISEYLRLSRKEQIGFHQQ